MFCLSKSVVAKFKEKIDSGEMDSKKLLAMGSKGRHDYFKSFAGEANAGKVNTLFESKLLLKSQEKGIKNWVSTLTNIRPSIKKDILSRFNRMPYGILEAKDMASFKEDLAKQKLGFGVTFEEAGKIVDLSTKTNDAKLAIDRKSDRGSDSRMKYGLNLVALKKYTEVLKSESDLSFLEGIKKAFGEKGIDDWVESAFGMAKGAVASMDNSFFLRQGFRTLIEKPDVWGNAFAKSWGDMSKEIKGIDAMDITRAEIFSRENALNGKYQDMGLEVGLAREEAYPESPIGKIPLLGRLYKASESAYNGAAIRMRADLADAFIREAEANGVDASDKKEGIGRLINSLTGRGEVNMAQKGVFSHKFVNAVFFSIKYVKSNIDTLFAPFNVLQDVPGIGKLIKKIKPSAGREEGKWARKKAALNTLKTIAVLGTVLAISKLLDPDSVEEDPRSWRFGKIWVGENHDIGIDIAFGLSSFVTLAAKIIPSRVDGEWGSWVKDKDGNFYNWREGGYGKEVGTDMIQNFILGKASPLAGMIVNYLRARDYSFQKPTLGSAALSLVTPMTAGQAWELFKSPDGLNILWQVILDALNFSGMGMSVPKAE